jgi:hypothetical protein
MIELFESLLLGENRDEQKANRVELVGNYGFYIEPSIVGFQGVHTSTVVLAVYADPSKKKPLEFSVKWSKILNNEPYEMEKYHEQHYHFTPSDIDLKIRAAITCHDPKYPGVAYLYVGPIEIDRSLLPEIEGLVLNLKGSFKIRALARDKHNLKPNNSLIRIDKPYLIINFDPDLEDMVLENSELPAFLPIEINFETDHSIKVRVDNYSTTNVVITFKDEQSENRLVVQFDSRERRDTFYICLRLLRSIKTTFLDRLVSEYDTLLSSAWSPMQTEMAEDEDEPVGELGLYEILRHDSIREHLRSMLRVKQELSIENLALTDSLQVMEDDLNSSAKQFSSLIEDVKNKKVRSLVRYEKSVSALGEMSFSILGDIKKGIKKGADQHAQPQISTKEITEEIKKIKEANVLLRKDLENLKQNKGMSSQGNSVQAENTLAVD